VAVIGQGIPLAMGFGSLLDFWLWLSPGNTLWIAPALPASGPVINSALRGAGISLEALNQDDFAQASD
jgi:hypothetical protein